MLNVIFPSYVSSLNVFPSFCSRDFRFCLLVCCFPFIVNFTLSLWEGLSDEEIFAKQWLGKYIIHHVKLNRYLWIMNYELRLLNFNWTSCFMWSPPYPFILLIMSFDPNLNAYTILNIVLQFYSHRLCSCFSCHYWSSLSLWIYFYMTLDPSMERLNDRNLFVILFQGMPGLSALSERIIVEDVFNSMMMIINTLILITNTAIAFYNIAVLKLCDGLNVMGIGNNCTFMLHYICLGYAERRVKTQSCAVWEH